jgi:hypothetical protein
MRIYNYPWLKAPIVIPRETQFPNGYKMRELNHRSRRMVRDFVSLEKEEKDAPSGKSGGQDSETERQ